MNAGRVLREGTQHTPCLRQEKESVESCFYIDPPHLSPSYVGKVHFHLRNTFWAHTTCWAEIWIPSGRNLWDNRAKACANKCKTQGSCRSAKSERSAPGLPFLLWLRKHVWNSQGVSEMVVLDLGLEALNSSSNGQCGKGVVERGGYMHSRAGAASCVCKLCTVSEERSHLSLPGLGFTTRAWVSGCVWWSDFNLSASRLALCSVNIWAEGGVRRGS